MAIFTVTSGESSELAVVKVTPQEFECFTLYEYIVTANQGDSITLLITGNDFESKYLNNNVETAFSDSAIFNYDTSLRVSFLLLNSGVTGVFSNATIRIQNNTTGRFYENFVQRDNDNANCYNNQTIPTNTSQLINDGELGVSTYVEQTDLNGYLPLAGGTMTGNINGGANELQNFTRLDIDNGGGLAIINNWTDATSYRLGTSSGSQLQYNSSADQWRIDASKILTSSNAAASEISFASYLTITSADTQAAIQELKDELDAVVASAGSGDMLKSIYDTGDNGIVDNSEALEGFTASQFLRSDVGATKFGGNLSFLDSIGAVFGTGNDMSIYHNGTENVISSDQSRDLLFQTNSTTRWTLDTSGDITGTNSISVGDEAYGVSWDGSLEVPTKNAVYDQIESLVLGGGVAWGGITGTLSDQSDLQTELDLKLDSASYTAADVLAKLITVDGAGSNIDADRLDGIDSVSFIKNFGPSGQYFSNQYLQFNGDGATNNDFISYNDTTNTYYFNADVALTTSSGNANLGAASLEVDNDVYDSAWNGDNTVPTKNAIFDHLDSLIDSGVDSSGLVLEGSTSGTYTISTQTTRWHQYDKLVVFSIEISNVNGGAPTGDLRLDLSGTTLPLMSGSYVFNVRTTGIGNSFYSIVSTNIGASLLQFEIQTSLDDDNSTNVVNANFTGTEDIIISGSFITT